MRLVTPPKIKLTVYGQIATDQYRSLLRTGAAFSGGSRQLLSFTHLLLKKNGVICFRNVHQPDGLFGAG